MRLSDEDYNTCVKKAVPDNHHTWPTNRDVASAAYALGVERARNTPDAATRAVIERLVGEVDACHACLKDLTQAHGQSIVGLDTELIAEARRLLEDAALSKPASEHAWLTNVQILRLFGSDQIRSQEAAIEFARRIESAVLARPAREGFVSVPVEWTSMRGLSITSSVEDGTWLRFDLPGGASAAISVLQLAEKFNEKSIVSQVLKEWSAMIATAKKGTEK